MEKDEGDRDDKHLLPRTFKQGGKCEYGTIDFIFNHKNIWSNLQNADPLKIMYELHDDTLWLPFIRDSIYPHKWDDKKPGDKDEEVVKFKKWQTLVLSEQTGGKTAANEVETKAGDPDHLKVKLLNIDYRVKGEFLQPFQPFYGPKERLDPMSQAEVKETEKRLVDIIEQTIKQMRSIAQINETSMIWTRPIRNFIDEYLNFMEDVFAGRYLST